MSNGEKLTEELPRVRVTEQFALELMREAAFRDCSISELVRLALHQWLHGNRTIRPSQDDG